MTNNDAMNPARRAIGALRRRSAQNAMIANTADHFFLRGGDQFGIAQGDVHRGERVKTLADGAVIECGS